MDPPPASGAGGVGCWLLLCGDTGFELAALRQNRDEGRTSRRLVHRRPRTDRDQLVARSPSQMVTVITQHELVAATGGGRDG
jgi:hypothetical protein